jgi:hypothetical protein
MRRKQFACGSILFQLRKQAEMMPRGAFWLPIAARIACHHYGFSNQRELPCY